MAEYIEFNEAHEDLLTSSSSRTTEARNPCMGHSKLALTSGTPSLQDQAVTARLHLHGG